MSYFGTTAKIEKKVVVNFGTKVYFTAPGLTQSLADDAAERILNRISYSPKTRNIKKYGEATYRDAAALARWKGHKARLRKKFFRRAFPLIERLFV